MWSVVTPSSSANDSTPAESRSTIINTLKVVSCVFDSATNALKVSWTIDTAGGLVLDSLEVGISYAPVEESQPDPVAIDSVLSLSDSATVIMAPLLFNRDYTMQMWVRKKNEEWAFPTAQSRDSVRTLPFTWQAVKYRFTEMGETVKWMNGKVSFATPPVPPANVKNYAFDTIRVFTPETGSSAGFVLAGPMFSFTGTKPSQPFTVGLKIDSLLLPAGRRPADARLYQYNPVLKRWVVRLAAVYDSVGKYRSLLTDSLGYAFAVMVDTLRPSIVALDTTDEAVEENTAVSNRVVVSDNVGNLTWRFLTAKGGEVFIMDRSRDSIMTKGIDTLTLTVDSKLVSDLNGVRIQVEADDGANRTTCDLSRRVVRQRSDQIVTPVLRWTPLRVTAQLDSPSVTRLLRFIDTSVAVPEYDKRHFRLYAWYPDASNAGETSKWVEYGTRPDSVFSGVPGRLLWVKTRAATLLHFGRGKTMSLKDTVRIVAKSKQWTDFALPYRFDITVGDILDATRHGADSLYADDLVIYRWDTTAGTYRCTPFFMADTSFAPGVGLNDRSKILSSNDAYAGYTVYNPSSSDIMMSFPPVSDLMSKYQSGFSKIAAGRGWVVKIVARLASGALLSPLYCGNKEGASGTVSFYPSAPSFDQVSVGVYDGRSGRVWGHVMEHGAAGGSSYLLTFRNDGDKAQEIRYTLSPSGLSPQAKMAVLDPATGTMTDAASSKPLTIQVDAGSSEYRWLIVGDMEYLASSGKRMAIGRLGLDGVYPNPVRNFATIRYTLPFGRVSRVEFLMLDIAGRTVSSAVVRERITLGGAREYQWKGRTGSGKRAAAGVYIVRMTAYDLKEHVIGSFDRRLTVLP
jgi:hypothetical protein